MMSLTRWERKTYIDSNGCSYTLTIDLVFNQLTEDILEYYVGCSGDGYSYTSPSGVSYNEANPVGVEFLVDANGCPYIVIVAFIYNPLSPNITESYFGCSGDGYSYTSPQNIVYDESNPTGTETYFDANGCPYSLIVDLVFNALTTDINESYTGCSGDGYSYTSPSGTVYDESNPSGTENLTDVNGCPYNVTVNLFYNALTANINESYIGCSGDGYSYTSTFGNRL